MVLCKRSIISTENGQRSYILFQWCRQNLVIFYFVYFVRWYLIHAIERICCVYIFVCSLSPIPIPPPINRGGGWVGVLDRTFRPPLPDDGWADFFFVQSVAKEKRCTYLKGFFQILWKSAKIDVFPNLRYNTSLINGKSPNTCVIDMSFGTKGRAFIYFFQRIMIFALISRTRE